MISIIICSVNSVFLKQVRKSIAETIGTAYELLVWENKENLGLCEVYNKMAERAQYEYICFLHEDIILCTNNWGQIIYQHFADQPDCGMIGIAGSSYKSSAASGWYTGDKNLDRYNILHRTQGVYSRMINPSKPNKRYYEVSCIDGVFICCRKKVWKEVRFDDILLKGFHFYDIDFSLRASKMCKVFVTMDIEVIHITMGGNFGNEWIETAILYHSNKQNFLPASSDPDMHMSIELEKRIKKQWLDWLKNFDITWKNKILWIQHQNIFGDPSLYYAMAKFLLYTPFRLRTLHQLIKR